MNREDLTAKDAKNELLFKEECYEIQGAIFEVYKEMGCGFLEAVYQECLEKELAKCDIPFQPQVKLHLDYKGEPLKQTYIPDFICYDKIIVEIIRMANSNFRDFSTFRPFRGSKRGVQ